MSRQAEPVEQRAVRLANQSESAAILRRIPQAAADDYRQSDDISSSGQQFGDLWSAIGFKLTPAGFEGEDRCDVPITNEDASGAVTCTVECEDIAASAVIDSGSGISVVSKRFLKKCGGKAVKYEGPSLCTVSGDCFKPSLAAILTVTVMDEKVTLSFAVVDQFAFDLLLGVAFMRRTPFWLNFRKL